MGKKASKNKSKTVFWKAATPHNSACCWVHAACCCDLYFLNVPTFTHWPCCDIMWYQKCHLNACSEEKRTKYFWCFVLSKWVWGEYYFIAGIDHDFSIALYLTRPFDQSSLTVLVTFLKNLFRKDHVCFNLKFYNKQVCNNWVSTKFTLLWDKLTFRLTAYPVRRNTAHHE